VTHIVLPVNSEIGKEQHLSFVIVQLSFVIDRNYPDSIHE
jgi:hypothetical protein